MAFVGPVELCVIFDNKDNHSTHEQNFAPAASLSCPAIDGASSTSGHFPLRNGLHRNRGHARREILPEHKTRRIPCRMGVPRRKSRL